MSSTTPSNYSVETSLPAYHSNPEGKTLQAQKVLAKMHSLGGKVCIKQLEEVLSLPASTLSGRINDLIAAGKVRDTGEKCTYQGMRRKVFALITAQAIPSVPVKTSFFE